MTKQSRPDLGSKTPEIKTEKRKAVGGDCKESNIEGKSARKYSRRWDIIVTAFDFVTNFSESSISAYAGQAAFFLMLSFFPFLLFFFSLLSWTPLTEADFLMWASSFIPESFGDIMKDLASEVYASGTGRLSITMITAVYLSSKAFISFQLGLDDMYHVKENRNFILRRIYSVLYSIVFALALIFLLGIMVFGNMLRKMYFSNVHHTRDERYSKQMKLVGYTVCSDCKQSRIAKDNLIVIVGCRVSVKKRSHISLHQSPDFWNPFKEIIADFLRHIDKLVM
jgi:membrane protein